MEAQAETSAAEPADTPVSEQSVDEGGDFPSLSQEDTPDDPPGLDKTSKPEQQAAKRKYKVKVDDWEGEVDEQELLSGYQRARAASKRFEEAARLRKETETAAEQLVEKLKTDLPGVAKKLGIDFKKLAEEHLYEELMADQITPEQKQLREYQKKIEALESEQQQRQQQEMHAQEQQYVEHYTKSFSEALEGAGMPVTTATVRRMAEMADVFLEAGMEPDVPALAQELAETQREETVSAWAGLEGDRLLATIPEDLLYRIRRADLDRLRGGGDPKPSSKAEEELTDDRVAEMTVDEHLDRLLGGQ